MNEVPHLCGTVWEYRFDFLFIQGYLVSSKELVHGFEEFFHFIIMAFKSSRSIPLPLDGKSIDSYLDWGVTHGASMSVCCSKWSVNWVVSCISYNCWFCLSAWEIEFKGCTGKCLFRFGQGCTRCYSNLLNSCGVRGKLFWWWRGWRCRRLWWGVDLIILVWFKYQGISISIVCC